MTQPKWPFLWLLYLVAFAALLFSVFFSFYLWFNLDDYLTLIAHFRNYVPWIALLFGIGIAGLLASNVRIAFLARQQSHVLSHVNENLKREINERIQAEESKQKLEVALLQGQKLQAMGTLAGGIAHDFNNLLYAIIGYTEMIREDMDKNTVSYHNLGKILEATHRGQELISRILSFSRRQHHQFSVIQINQTIEAALSLLRPTVPASVTIHFQSDFNGLIMGNQTQIHQVLVNLINNAVDAMDGEGTISILVSDIPKNDPMLNEFPETKGKNYCKIEITDTGHGMDQHTMERIFEPFYTTKEVGKGTGLGLSIVHSIIKEHQGEITLTSQLGRGTKFIILLPVHTDI